MTDLYLFGSALRDLTRARRLAITAGLVILPAAVALALRLAARGRFDGAIAYNALASLLVFGFLLVILSVVFSTGAIGQEMEQKTIVYLLTRPVPRWRILLARFAAATLLIVATGWLALLLLAAATYSPRSETTPGRVRATTVRDYGSLATRLRDASDPVSEYVRNELSPEANDLLDAYDGETPPSRELRTAIWRGLDRLVRSGAPLYNEERFSMVTLDQEVRALAARRPTGPAAARLNRLLLEAAYPEEIVQSRGALSRLPRDILVLPVGALAYGSVFLLLATLFSRSLIGGLLFAFGWESWVPLMRGKFQLLSIMTYLRVLAPHPKPEAASVDITQILSLLTPEVVSARAAWAVLASVIVLGLAASLLSFSVREYVPRDDAG